MCWKYQIHTRYHFLPHPLPVEVKTARAVELIEWLNTDLWRRNSFPNGVGNDFRITKPPALLFPLSHLLYWKFVLTIPFSPKVSLWKWRPRGKWKINLIFYPRIYEGPSQLVVSEDFDMIYCKVGIDSMVAQKESPNKDGLPVSQFQVSREFPHENQTTSRTLITRSWHSDQNK